MINTIRHRRFPLERKLPIRLYYSTNPEKAKILIHTKRIKQKLQAIRRVHLFELEHCKDKTTLMQGYFELVQSVEERYVDVALPKQIVLILIRTRRRIGNVNLFNQRLDQVCVANPER